MTHLWSRYGKTKRTLHGRGTKTHRCGQSISDGWTPLKNLRKRWQIKGKGLRKWIGRYDNSGKNSKKEWFRDESRAPKNVHRKTDSEVEQLIINVRKSLMEGKTEDTKYRCYFRWGNTISDAWARSFGRWDPELGNNKTYHQKERYGGSKEETIHQMQIWEAIYPFESN